MSKPKTSKALLAATAKYQTKQIKQGNLKVVAIKLNGKEFIELYKKIPCKAKWLKKALKTLNENGEIK